MTPRALLSRAHNARAVAEAQCTKASVLLVARIATLEKVDVLLTVAAEYLEAEQQAYDRLHETGEWQEIPA
jgi:hypothetical protein